MQHDTESASDATIGIENDSIADKEYENRVHHNKMVGLWLILTPIIVIFCILFAYAMMSFVLKTITSASAI